MDQKRIVTKPRSLISKAIHVACGIGVLAVICSFFGLGKLVLATLILIPVASLVIWVGAFILAGIEVMWRSR